MKRLLTIGTLLAITALGSGYAASHAWQRYQNQQSQRRIHAEIAAIRTYEEGFALRHGHYLLLPNSCDVGGDEPWRTLGKARPTAEVGCFWVTAPGALTGAVTAPTLTIVGENVVARLRGTESSDDRQPTWETVP